VVVSDTMGRAWRVGQTDAAIGADGLRVLDDLRSGVDSSGRVLDVTVRAVADEVAGVAELVAGKASRVPAVVVRGLQAHVLPPDDHGLGARAILRDPAEDRFSLGTAEAKRQAVLDRRTVREFSDEPVPLEALERAVAAAATAPAPHRTRPWRFVHVRTPVVRLRLLTAMRARWEADLRADGFDERAVARRVSRGDLLWGAPELLVPCLLPHGMHPYPDARRREAEHAMFTLAMGAGIQNLLVALAAEGLGSAWLGSTLFCPDEVRSNLDLSADLTPCGAVAIGWPRSGSHRRHVRDTGECHILR
jgi:coenzyme F420-0:L-glutamate ligase/coenzyme F420-1:gamma-L-glutamate ligase